LLDYLVSVAVVLVDKEAVDYAGGADDEMPMDGVVVVDVVADTDLTVTVPWIEMADSVDFHAVVA